MIHRAVQQDRHQTNFFWPDESEAEEVPSRSRRRGSNAPAAAQATQAANNEKDVKPKELFQKQLSSCIQFYDNVNAKTPEARRRRFKKIDNVNVNNVDSQFAPEKKKLETFSSKIEFYDFVDKPNDAKCNNARPKPEIKMQDNDAPKKAIGSPDASKKRISFKSEPAKGILKNAEKEEKKSAEPMSSLLPKHMSKSVDNMAKFAKSAEATEKPEKLSSIIREVKNMEISSRHRRNHDYDDEDDFDHYRKGPRRPPPPTGFYRDEDRGYYRRDPRDYRYERPFNGRHVDYDDDYDYDRRYRREPEPNARSPRGERPQEGRRPRHEPDTFENHRPSQRHVERRKPQNDGDEQPIRKPRNDEKEAEPSNNIASNAERREYYAESSSPQSSGNFQPHLRSNITFSGANSPQPNKPLSIRDSAVTRVGVGLPDI